MPVYYDFCRETYGGVSLAVTNKLCELQQYIIMFLPRKKILIIIPSLMETLDLLSLSKIMSTCDITKWLLFTIGGIISW